MQYSEWYRPLHCFLRLAFSGTVQWHEHLFISILSAYILTSLRRYVPIVFLVSSESLPDLYVNPISIVVWKLAKLRCGQIVEVNIMHYHKERLLRCNCLRRCHLGFYFSNVGFLYASVLKIADRCFSQKLWISYSLRVFSIRKALRSHL